MSLLNLPTELLCQICENLHTVRDIASFSKVSHRLHGSTEVHLYRCDACNVKSSTLLWAASHGRMQTLKKALRGMQRDEQLTGGFKIDDETTVESPTDPVNIALVYAAEKGHAAHVRLLAEHSADLNWREPERRQSSIEAACSKGHIEVVKVLLYMGAEPDEGHYKRPYPVQCAAFMGYPEIVRLLNDAGADVDTCSSRPEGGFYRPSQLAVRGGHEHTTKLLVAKDARITLRIGRMQTALEEAVIVNQSCAVKFLLALGAMIFATAPGLVRCPALEWAKRPGCGGIYELLRDQTVHVWPSGCSEEDMAAIEPMP